MKRFHFPLESVRTLRGLREQRAREAFAIELRNLEKAEQRFDAMRDYRRTLTDGLATTRGGTFRPAHQTSAIAALEFAIHAEAEAAKVRAEAAARLDRAREHWMECRRQLEVIQRLGDRARLAHIDAGEKAEQAVLDELATVGASRGNPWMDRS